MIHFDLRVINCIARLRKREVFLFYGNNEVVNL